MPRPRPDITSARSHPELICGYLATRPCAPSTLCPDSAPPSPEIRKQARRIAWTLLGAYVSLTLLAAAIFLARQAVTAVHHVPTAGAAVHQINLTSRPGDTSFPSRGMTTNER
jgi:hypothetical protein